ncbi:MAG: hypothetical protein ACREV5_11015 [Steroidobacter sp.]
MTIAAERLAVNVPGRMESHAARRAFAISGCTLQELDPEDLQQTMCDAFDGEERRLLPRTDEMIFRLHLEFMRAHGAPKGEFTTFSNASAMTSGSGRAERPAST